MDLRRAAISALPGLLLSFGCSTAASFVGGPDEDSSSRNDSNTSPNSETLTDVASGSTDPSQTRSETAAPGASGSSNIPGSDPSHAPSSGDSWPPDGTASTGGGRADSTASPADAQTSSGETSAPNSSAECTFDLSATLSEQIATVGILTFSTNLGEVDGGYIEFGKGTEYGSKAPIDTRADNHRTLLLGMQPATQYHYRIVAHSGDKVCQSGDGVLTTGEAPTTLQKPTLRVDVADKIAPGYLITTSQATDSSGFYIAIYDHLGQPVWWYRSAIGGLPTRAKLSWDGKYLYARDGNPSARSGGQVARIAMDGSSEESLTVDTGHHDFAVAPDNQVLFLIGGGGENCGRIEKWSGTDESSVFYDLRDAFGEAFKTGADPCHCNSIHYNPADESVTVSCLTQNAYVKLSKDAELLWVLGGNNGQSHFVGDIAWNRQHGHQMLTPNRILFLNNNGGGDSTSETSLAVEVELDLDNQTAERVWEYDGGEVTQTLGDVQRLANGNTLVTYCNAGMLREVDASKVPVQTWQFVNGVGYSDHRATLYGSPDRP